MKKDKRFSLRLRTYYLLIIAIVVIISFGAVVGALTALQQLGVIGHINVSTLVALLLVAAAASGSASFLVGRRVLAPMVKLSKASREVARGNYSITVEDPSKLEEVQTTLRNFNALVREMNRINNVTNDFVSSVSHEFKTPLTAIEGYAMLLQDTGLTQAERDEYLDKILYNTHRLSTLVGNILMLSKLENQSLSDQRSTFRLDEQLRQAVVMLEPQWEEKSLSFRAELDAVSVTACRARCCCRSGRTSSAMPSNSVSRGRSCSCACSTRRNAPSSPSWTTAAAWRPRCRRAFLRNSIRATAPARLWATASACRSSSASSSCPTVSSR